MRPSAAEPPARESIRALNRSNVTRAMPHPDPPLVILSGGRRLTRAPAGTHRPTIQLRVTRRNDMAAQSDSSSDPTRTQALGGSAAGAHAAPAAADRTVPVRSAGSDAPTSSQPTSTQRTSTHPTSSDAPGDTTTIPATAGRAAAPAVTSTDTDRDRGRGRGAPRAERQQVVAAQ